ncbi:putative mucin TcMUCII [Trypanosoma cruzi]|uniref:Mucin TcMUCII, putative n=2 Tax=Trypanosoma cruzi TaxID=5693 RepID=Q4DNG9_TRYCC|nr:mucin TcMUCII, putative [Trypanosoma cruzi]EAN94063.1 mucin TcMUCII, putative [Trypanosoma cruzi]PWV15826.1 putative mucin TcMUCII [Trypanosoma cruzi]RNC31926.1 mucin TcMUCII [Trypanosoma cruzi]|eukprot:XP_815914.1 mucin TcMUCII [Trypanosoma cruzi strain CL Brener]
MMTCRLLCALLVVALCCCPSVCATKAQLEDTGSLVEEVGEIQPPLPQQTPAQKGEGPGAENGNTARGAGKGGGKTTPHPQSSATPNKVQEKGAEETSGTKIVTRASTEQGNKNVDDSTEEAAATSSQTTTTTTTKSPTTTTTSTTTTEAPSTTTTEAPTTTTTRAPSRLREMDGSLSSSAWVCAPLVLAASALAYTAVG